MHWTYAPVEDKAKDELEQGDILLPTPALRSILAEVHPHFATDKYHAFIVTTQSCDLVLRGKKGSKARHISIAAVRPLRQVLPRLLSSVCTPSKLGSATVLPESKRVEVSLLLERILNQNEQSLGLFYLHPENDVSLAEECVAFLRVTVALRAEHYEILVNARSGRLDSEFRGKLGWLVGNLYSRAAAPDWSDQVGGPAVQKKLIDEFIKEDAERGIWWVADDLIAAARKAKVVLEGDDVMGHLQKLEPHRPKPPMELLIAEVKEQIGKILLSPPAIMERRRRICRVLEGGVDGPKVPATSGLILEQAVADDPGGVDLLRPLAGVPLAYPDEVHGVDAGAVEHLATQMESICREMVELVGEKIAKRLQNSSLTSLLKR